MEGFCYFFCIRWMAAISCLLSTFCTEPLEMVVMPPFLFDAGLIFIIDDSEISADAAPLRLAFALDWAEESPGLLLADV